MARTLKRAADSPIRAAATSADAPAPVEASWHDDGDGNMQEAALNERLLTDNKAADAAAPELDSFYHVLSHDLRAPLRCIDGFGQALLEDHADKLGDDGREQLRYIREAAQEMSQLIDGLLTLSRVTRSAMHLSQVDLSELAQLTAARLRADEPDRQVETIITRDLVAGGDGEQLRLVIEHLLGNAWKFTANARLRGSSSGRPP